MRKVVFRIEVIRSRQMLETLISEITIQGDLVTARSIAQLRRTEDPERGSLRQIVRNQPDVGRVARQGPVPYEVIQLLRDRLERLEGSTVFWYDSQPHQLHIRSQGRMEAVVFNPTGFWDPAYQKHYVEMQQLRGMDSLGLDSNQAQRIYDQAGDLSLDAVRWTATHLEDDQLGWDCLMVLISGMTSPTCRTGWMRLAAVLDRYGYKLPAQIRGAESFGRFITGVRMTLYFWAPIPETVVREGEWEKPR